MVPCPASFADISADDPVFAAVSGAVCADVLAGTRVDAWHPGLRRTSGHQSAPPCPPLVCGPPDAAHGRHGSNAHLDGFVQALRTAALEDGAAFFDLRAAQGGDGSYIRWREADLAGKDGVHYRYDGYRLMGQWLLDALQAVGTPHEP